MRTVHQQYAPLLEGTVEMIVKCFAAVHYAKLLDSAAQVCATTLDCYVCCILLRNYCEMNFSEVTL